MRCRTVKHAILWMIGGTIYVCLELVWRGRSHWTMFVLGGVCFILLGLINNFLPWETPLCWQIVLGTAMVTAAEFLAGLLVNRILGWQVWDYSYMRGNILGQICPQYTILWVPASAIGIILDDWLRYWLFGEEKPHYKIK